MDIPRHPAPGGYGGGTPDTTDITVRDNPAEQRYEAVLDGEVVGEIRYRTRPGVIVLVHTEVAPAVEGRGVGSRLVSAALDDIRARGLRLVPICPFVQAYLGRHPEYGDLLARPRAVPQ